MAQSMKRKTNTDNIDNVDNFELTEKEEIVEEIEIPVKETKKKEYKATDGVPCRSITTGKLFMVGLKSHITYEWANEGDVTEIEYQDLISAIRSNSSYVMKPFFIIEDNDIVKQFAQVDRVYKNMYSLRDLREVFKLSPSKMKTTILSLPDGAKDSIKHIAANMISNGSLDSVQKIRVLDEIFDTKFMLMTELFNA